MHFSILTRRALSPALLLIILIAQACTVSPRGLSLDGTPLTGDTGRSAQLVAQTNFTASLPEPLQPGETLSLTVMDEVTGLLVNSISYPMQRNDDLTYQAVLPLPIHAAVKYRYTRQSSGVVHEDTARGTAIRYRLYIVNGPGNVWDTIADWADRAYARPTGTLQGRVRNADTGSPIPNLLVTAGGATYITDSEGRFELSGLAAATHNFVVYSMDGAYRPFQQGATVAADQTTTVDLAVEPSTLVNVTFEVAMPDDTVAGVPVRIAGNLLQFGNTFADLQGGMSTSADRMPVMNLTAEGRYTLSIALPAGTHLQYKYTLGDGFWNAEHTDDGAFMVREFVVPTEDAVVSDAVAGWAAGDGSPITFEVVVPQVTPPGDIIHIQFNPYGWTEPIPMWPLGNNQWAYKLFGPLNTVGTFGYRYCRNGQCGSADDASTAGESASGRLVSATLLPQNITDSVGTWLWYENPEPTTLVGSVIAARPEGFVTGVEFQSAFRPNWTAFEPQALANIRALGANQLVITPTWTIATASPLTFVAVPGQDPLWSDTARTIGLARSLGLNVALFPQPRFASSWESSLEDPASAFWSRAPRTTEWWNGWFDHYLAFAVNFGDLAAQTGADTLVLGGEWVTPALPGGLLPDGSPSNIPPAVETRWSSVMATVRRHFNGRILWALPFTEASLQAPLPVLKEADGIYLLWDAGLSESPAASTAAYAEEAGRLLDNEVSPLPSVLGKPLYLAIGYASAAGSASGCIAEADVGCLPWEALSRPNPDVPSVGLDLQAQADLYEGMLSALNARPWISGVISRGYYPPAALQDKSASVHGKPAADILWYWLPRLAGIVQ